VCTAESNCSFHSFENKAKRQSSLFRFLEEPDLTVRRSHSHGNKRGLDGNIKNRSFPERKPLFNTRIHQLSHENLPGFRSTDDGTVIRSKMRTDSVARTFMAFIGLDRFTGRLHEQQNLRIEGPDENRLLIPRHFNQDSTTPMA
jgi:hypothetical protein